MLLSLGYRIFWFSFVSVLLFKKMKEGWWDFCSCYLLYTYEYCKENVNLDLAAQFFKFFFFFFVYRFLAGVTAGATYLVNSSMILEHQTSSEYVIIQCFQRWCPCKHFLNPVLQIFVSNSWTSQDHVLHCTVWIKFSVFFNLFFLPK